MQLIKNITVLLSKRIIALVCMMGIAEPLLAASEPRQMHWTIDGVERQAVVYVPESAKQTKAPVVFVFHGHGGTMNNILRGKNIDKLWPEAIIVSPQGLNTPGQITDSRGELPGWQKAPGDMNDRDLLLFDAILKTLHEEYKVDDKRIYATGHSNGGSFTYVLMEARSDILAAAAPCAAAAIRALPRIKPKPMMHIIGEKDPLVKPSWQEITINGMLKINSCSKDGQAYATDATLYPSSTGNPVIVYKHAGGHTYPQEAVELAIKFFKGVSKQ